MIVSLAVTRKTYKQNLKSAYMYCTLDVPISANQELSTLLLVETLSHKTSIKTRCAACNVTPPTPVIVD